jgi:hypothetical protein
MARNVLLEIFQAIETPFSSTLALDGEHLPELALGVRALGHGKLAVEHPRVARGIVGRFEQALVDLALAIDPARADGHDHLGEGSVGDQFAALLRLGVVHVEHRGHPLLG